MIEDWYEIEDQFDEEFSIDVYIKVNKLHSIIMANIASNFN